MAKTAKEETKKDTKIAAAAEATKPEAEVVPEKVTEVETTELDVTEEKVATAKAGKRSKKAIEEETQKEAKEVKKATGKEAKAEPKKPEHIQNPKRLAKNRKASLEKIEAGKLYGLAEGVKLLREVSTVKFDATCELHFNLGIDPRQADQTVRTSVALPAGTGKKIRVAVLANDKLTKSAKEAGADLASTEDILADLKKGKFDFDVLVATPDQMANLGKFAKVLGPKGLMPSPKSGTVSADPAAAVKEIKAGRAELKNDANGIVHVAFGKLSFKDDDLFANAKTIVVGISKAKPSGVKGTYIKSITLAATMSPGIHLDPAAVNSEVR